jgi:hypothetical protein
MNDNNQLHQHRLFEAELLHPLHTQTSQAQIRAVLARNSLDNE